MKTILLIEDDEPVIELMKSFLGTEYVILSHLSGEAAIQEINRITPDLIIVDLYLKSGGLSGLDTLSFLHRTPGLSQIPIMAISGRADRYDIDHALAMGATTFIAKPYSLQHLLVEIEKLLDG